MVIFIKQRGGIVLTVDVDQLDTQLAQDRHSDDAAVDPADISAI